jgi:SagB-type dehydrogenase family enzyme
MGIIENREFIKGYRLKNLHMASDQQKGLPQPAVALECPSDTEVITLMPPDEISIGTMPLAQAIKQRRSRRQFSQKPLTFEELSFLLHATQGVHAVQQTRSGKILNTLRTTPSAGARHAIETYLVINSVEGVKPGLYRYMALNHQLCALSHDPDLPYKIVKACLDQNFMARGAVIFIWTAVAYRMEWRYGVHAAKLITLDAGHICQNLYLAAESIGCGACAIGAFVAEWMDAVIGVDGDDETTIYIAPVGKTQ